MLAFEVALPLGALAFYLYDCGMLLYDDELLLLRQRASWRVMAGGDVVLFRKRVCMPAPFAPWLSIFRAYFRSAPQVPVAEVQWPPHGLEAALLPVRVLCCVLLALLVVALPVTSLAFGAGLLLLAVFAAFYLLVLAALAVVFARRQQLGVTGRAFWLLALDVLACAPFAVNMVRRISLRHELPQDALRFGRQHLAGDELARLETLAARVAQPSA